VKITDVKPYPVWVGHRNQMLVKVETDAGIHGWGESGLSGRELAVAGAVRHYREFLIGRNPERLSSPSSAPARGGHPSPAGRGGSGGRDPMRSGALWQEMYRSQYFEGGRVLTAAISAIDIALHDIVGKALKVPVYQLLGGKQRDHVPTFATTPGPFGPALIEQGKRLLDAGWNCFRLSSESMGIPGGRPRPDAGGALRQAQGAQQRGSPPGSSLGSERARQTASKQDALTPTLSLKGRGGTNSPSRRGRRSGGQMEREPTEWEPGLYEPRYSIAKTAEMYVRVREALGREVVLGVDYHHRLSVAEAASFLQMMPVGTLDFIEEPIRDESPEAYEALRKMTPVPFAIGEEFSSKWQFLPYIERGITNYARLDLCNVGGFTEAMKVAGWAEAHYIDLMPHNPLGPICTIATVHMAAAIPNFSWLETWRNPWAADRHDDDRIFRSELEFKDAHFTVPDAPGLGIEVNEDQLNEPFRPWEAPHLHRADGSYTNW
jgi:L-alanine-DL-glutamate epimerase-like enolase superfamily enzyme